MPEPVGSWPSYYDSLTLFSPARYSSLPGMPFPGDPDHYPHRDEVVDYLRRYAKNLDADIRTGHRVTAVRRDGDGFTIQVEDGTELTAPIVIAASGAFGRPHRPALPGLDSFTGTVLHSADYREPSPFAGQRVIVVGAANTAVQIGYELAKVATVTLATRKPVKFAPQRPLGRDVHFWSVASGFDHLPIGHLLAHHTAHAGQRRRPLPQAHHGRANPTSAACSPPSTATRSPGPTAPANTSTPSCSPPATDPHCPTWTRRPRQCRGLSTVHPGLGFVGLEWQRSFASATLRGVGRDARYVVRRLLRNVNSA